MKKGAFGSFQTVDKIIFEVAEGLGKQTVHYFATQSRLRLPPLLGR